ncbi:hypothetical protein AATO11_004849 [Salmonella enterica]|nr:bacteriophage CI repressor [Salmonella enterica]ECH7873416.1 bacteriophage CI repressor [Salmonella enterica subsp. enterica serovar Rubislaw]EAX7088357.1 bacteriophage CI repressor [Salmonella enterica]EDZ6368052.1 bacteriophage CI repressor [Salmonella enterica]EIF6312021.1 hypothetical protein [Salmonella enterica]
MRKERERSFVDKTKEPIIERIFTLVDRYSSRNEAAAAWGININTLQNYYKRRELAPVPRKKLLQQIANHEGVSIEWLQYGHGEPPAPVPVDNEHKKTNEHKVTREEDIDASLLTLLGTLSEKEKISLYTVLVRKGVETILHLLDEDNINLLKQRQNRATQATQRATEQPEREYTTQELETMIMTLPVRESLKTAFARGITAGEDADKEILRILESHQQGLSPEGSDNKTTTPDQSLKQKAG